MRTKDEVWGMGQRSLIPFDLSASRGSAAQNACIAVFIGDPPDCNSVSIARLSELMNKQVVIRDRLASLLFRFETVVHFRSKQRRFGRVQD